MTLTRIISGGQTGVDCGALCAALVMACIEPQLKKGLAPQPPTDKM